MRLITLGLLKAALREDTANGSSTPSSGNRAAAESVKYDVWMNENASG
jgi:hypothetical protein